MIYTNENSFIQLKEYWYNQMKEFTKGEAIFVVAGNKSENYENKKVSNEEGEEWAKSISAVFFETSAVNGIGINAMFNYIGEKINNPNYDFYAEKEKRKENKKNKEEKKSKNQDEKKPKIQDKKKCVIY